MGLVWFGVGVCVGLPHQQVVVLLFIGLVLVGFMRVPRRLVGGG